MMTNFWNPWSIFDELDRSVFDVASRSRWPEFDIEDTDDETVLTADVPGMTADDIDVTIQDQHLIVRGERKANPNLVRRNRYYGAFERRFRLGDGYDEDGVTAQIANGELTIHVAKAARAKPRKIKLTSGVVEKVKGLLGGHKDKDSKSAA
jgi:HSP20 family protein